MSHKLHTYEGTQHVDQSVDTCSALENIRPDQVAILELDEQDLEQVTGGWGRGGAAAAAAAASGGGAAAAAAAAGG